MTRKRYSGYLLQLMAGLLLLAACSVLGQAQKTCTEKLAQATQLINGKNEEIRLDEQKIREQQDLIGAQDRKINDQRQLLDQLDARNANLRATIANQDNTIAELKKQITTLEDNVKLAQQNAQINQTIAELNKQFIEVQKAAIDALVKTGKRSAIEKFVDSLPSIAGIIAVALTHTR